MNNSISDDCLLEFATKLTILYVEDDKDTRELALELFSNIFNNIIVATNGEEGIARFNKEIDLIITDINMPKISGIEMLQEIKKINKFVDTMIISAHNDTPFFTQTIELGVDGYLLKPIDSNSFYKALLKVLEKIFLRKELEQHKLSLERKVKEQIYELEEKNNALVQQSKLASMGEIMDIVAHQWKQPLNLISMKANFLQEYYSADKYVTIEEVQECSSFVSQQITHLVNTIDEFRGFLRPNTNMDHCNLFNIFNSVKLLLKDDFIQNKINIDIQCDEKLAINANANEIKHIFISLISNSKDAFNINNIKNRTITINVSQNEKDIIILYKDNAGGIDPLIIDKIFEANTSTKKDIGGTGIGLYMVSMIITKYSGKVTVNNEDDGVCFSLSFRKKQ